MWISRMLARNAESERAEKGYVTMGSGDCIEAGSSVNSRSIENYTPYGYSAAVPQGEEVILVPSSDGSVALGTRSKNEELESGEVKISSKGGASIVLKNDGRVIINGSYIINSQGVPQ